MKGTLTTPSMLRLKESICDGRIYQTRHLLESGVDVNFADEEGLTPLMRAAQLPDEKSRTRHNLLKLQGHPTTIFERISVRKTILDLEVSEHLL